MNEFEKFLKFLKENPKILKKFNEIKIPANATPDYIKEKINSLVKKYNYNFDSSIIKEEDLLNVSGGMNLKQKTLGAFLIGISALGASSLLPKNENNTQKAFATANIETTTNAKQTTTATTSTKQATTGTKIISNIKTAIDSKENLENYNSLFKFIQNKDLGSFNEKFGKFAKFDEETIKSVQQKINNLQISSPKNLEESKLKFKENLLKLNLNIDLDNDATLYRLMLSTIPKNEENTSILENISKKILESEKKHPSLLKGGMQFEKLLEQGFENNFNEFSKNLEQLENTNFSGMDSYLAKQFLSATKKLCESKGITFPKKLEKALETFRKEEIFIIGDSKKLGGGRFNTVYSAKIFKDGKIENKVFKPIASANKEAKEGKTATSVLSGISGKATHAAYAERCVLTQTADELLDFGICPKTNKVLLMPGLLSSGQDAKIPSCSGIIMDSADGEAMVLKKVKLEIKNSELTENGMEIFKTLITENSSLISENFKGENLEKFANFFVHILKTDKKMSKSKIVNEMKKQKLSFNADIVKKVIDSFDIVENSEKNIILSNENGFKRKLNDRSAAAKALEGSIKLGFMDYLTGQTDRHLENYFIDANGKLLAIDNDLCFGTKAAARGQKNALVIIPNNASLLVNLPKIITSEVKGKLENFLKEKAQLFLDNVANAFGNNSQEYEKTLSRINDIEKALKNIKTVATANDLLKEENISLIDSETNYIARDLKVNRSDYSLANSKGWNPYRLNKKTMTLNISDILLK